MRKLVKAVIKVLIKIIIYVRSLLRRVFLKKINIIVFGFLTLTSSAFAFTPQIDFFAGGESASFSLFNTTDRLISCEGSFFAQTYAGNVLSSSVNQLVLKPGMNVTTNINSDGRDPFINAWAQIDCQLLK